jgi:ABC-type dipeptide/oligopeptide/nickel transport system permease subunit
MSGGAARSIIMRAIDGMMAFPGILLAMMLVAVLGKGLPARLSP